MLLHHQMEYWSFLCRKNAFIMDGKVITLSHWKSNEIFANCAEESTPFTLDNYAHQSPLLNEIDVIHNM